MWIVERLLIKSLNIQPSSSTQAEAESLCTAALVSHRLGFSERAINFAKKAIQVSPKLVDAHLVQASLVASNTEMEGILVKAIDIGREYCSSILTSKKKPESLWDNLICRPYLRAMWALGSFYFSVKNYQASVVIGKSLIGTYWKSTTTNN